MPPPADGDFEIRNIGRGNWLTVRGDQIEVAELTPNTTAQKWRLTNYDGYITLNNVGNEKYFAPRKDEPDFPIVPTRILTCLNCTDGSNGKIISFCGGNGLLVMMAKNNGMVELGIRHESDAKQQWEFWSTEEVVQTDT